MRSAQLAGVFVLKVTSKRPLAAICLLLVPASSKATSGFAFASREIFNDGPVNENLGVKETSIGDVIRTQQSRVRVVAQRGANDDRAE